MDRWTLRPANDLELPARERLRSLRRESGFASTAVRAGWWLLVRAYLRLYHRLEVRGRENLPPAPPFVLVANHASHLDALTLAAGLPLAFCDRTHALAAGDTFFTTLWGSAFAAVALNALPIWRARTQRNHLTVLRERLAEERCVFLIFPEGTRSRDGTMAPFKPGLGALVAGAAIPVVPCHIAGAHAAMPPQARLPRPRRLALTIGAPLSFAGTAHQPDGWREIAAAAEAAVRALAQPTVGAESSQRPNRV
jgi:1-acyl-sn-glycerol-3-phosphate acyltransferase